MFRRIAPTLTLPRRRGREWEGAGAGRRGVAILAAILLLLPLGLGDSYDYDVVILVGLNAIACVGLNLLIGHAGQVSLGHAAFFGIGAYASAILTHGHGWPAPVALLAGIAAAVLLAVAIGRPILRLEGHYLAMATLGMGIIVAIVVANEDRLTGGPDGMAVAPFRVLGWTLAGERAWYCVVAAVLLLTVQLAENLVASPIGRALRAIHGSEVAAAAAGVDAARYKLLVFVLSAGVAALAGSLSAHYSGFVTPAKVGFFYSIELVTMVAFGGMASTMGALVGAAALTALPQLLTVLRDYETVVFGAVLMATMILMPQGLVPSLARLLRRSRR